MRHDIGKALISCLLIVALFVILAIAGVAALANITDRQARLAQAHGNARAHVIQAEGQRQIDIDTGAVRKIEAQAKAQTIQAETEKETNILRAESQATLRRAEAQEIRLSALLPWGVLGLLGLSLIALIVVTIVKRPQRRIERIETRVMYLPAPSAPRREVWEMMSAQADKRPLLIDVKK